MLHANESDYAKRRSSERREFAIMLADSPRFQSSKQDQDTQNVRKQSKSKAGNVHLQLNKFNTIKAIASEYIAFFSPYSYIC